MRFRLLARLVALLLVPCLITDLAVGRLVFQDLTPMCRQVRSECFTSQALAEALGSFGNRKLLKKTDPQIILYRTAMLPWSFTPNPDTSILVLIIGVYAAFALGTTALWQPIYEQLREDKKRTDLPWLPFLKQILLGRHAAEEQFDISSAVQMSLWLSAAVFLACGLDALTFHVYYLYSLAKAAVTIIGFFGARAAWKAWPGIQRRILTAVLTAGFIMTLWNPQFKHWLGPAFENLVTEPASTDPGVIDDKSNELFLPRSYEVAA